MNVHRRGIAVGGPAHVALFDYEFTVTGVVPESTLIEIEGMRVISTTRSSPHCPAQTVMRGPVPDQAALHGIMNRLYNVALDIVQVRRLVEADQDVEPISEAVLGSWRAGKARRAILDFIGGATTPGGPDFVAPADRIAAFDNDGTLWVEQPLPPQFDFVFSTWAREVRQDPSMAQLQPYKAIIERDPAFFQGVATQEPAVIASLLAAFGQSWAGSTPAEFESQVREWMATARQPKLGVSYLELVYQPMLELFELLSRNGFRIFVCSGGGRDFMRVFAEETWGVYQENVIGSAAEYTYIDGGVVRGEELLGKLNLGPGKPEHIFAQTGRLPVFAGGNADIDIEMLESARFALLINHDDPDREFAYTAAAEASMAKAAQLGWTVVSMRDDWSTVYGHRPTTK
jgi:phosphoserine phosphatase